MHITTPTSQASRTPLVTTDGNPAPEIVMEIEDLNRNLKARGLKLQHSKTSSNRRSAKSMHLIEQGGPILTTIVFRHQLPRRNCRVIYIS